ncbi:MAG: DUF6265 family protein [Candidatus Acidiferrales bacterium]
MNGNNVYAFIRLTFGALILLGTLSPPVSAQHPAGTNARPAAKPANAVQVAQAPAISSATPANAAGGTARASQATLADFTWLEGRWEGAWGPRMAEQVWMPARAGQMLGVFRVVGNNKTLVIELFSLRQTPDGIELLLRHFTPSLVPWEKSGPAILKLARIDPKRAVFENDEGGSPKRSIFTRIDPDTFSSRSEIVPDASNEQVTEIVYHRQKPAAPR